MKNVKLQMSSNELVVLTKTLLFCFDNRELCMRTKWFSTSRGSIKWIKVISRSDLARVVTVAFCNVEANKCLDFTAYIGCFGVESNSGWLTGDIASEPFNSYY